MRKITGSIDGLNCGSVIYDEVEQNLRETLESDTEARQAFLSPIIKGAGDDIQLIGGIDWSSGKDWSVIVRHPRLLAKKKK
ncbi:hypothetical protein FT641_21230 [Bacillus paranthracis]|uniref:Uncharacterized protein n=1 Tax=Bacillus cereus (strain AH820) TaxID=405535 RepID=B7JPB1_BACC0|nr:MULTISPECIES: hypothetical protein [Bacillus cereus group]EEK41975.1 hypothetical protein bcere0001_51390 [Bacillus cereus m1293]EJR11153.1 hypothetical protein II9_04853 [Bacillus cereus MSX-D12]ACK91980.1 hypothetical protein BCAH820_0578 [Bacillus cereus AH820]KMP64405.1 hypothetical protein TU61_23435 [Bacillus cereus]KMP65562.1 hypothetical protein TU61_19530 [Bacillus cereus]